MPIDFEHVHEDLNPKSLLTSDELSSDSFVQKVAREVYVVGGGTLAGAAKECYDDVTQHTGEFALRTAGGVVIGALLSASHFGPMPIRCAGRAISVGLGLAMLSDLLDRRRWSELGTAISDTWSSSNGLDKNFAAVQKTLGRLTYETALMAGGAKLGALGTTAGFKAAGFKLPLDASSARPGTQPESGDQLTAANRVHYAQGKPGTLDGQIRLAAEKRASEALAARREQEAADMLLRDKQTQAKPRETSEETWPVYQETRLLGEMNWRLNQRLDLLKHGEYALAEDFRADMRSLLHENNKQWFREHEKWRSTVDPGYKSRPESFKGAGSNGGEPPTLESIGRPPDVPKIDALQEMVSKRTVDKSGNFTTRMRNGSLIHESKGGGVSATAFDGTRIGKNSEGSWMITRHNGEVITKDASGNRTKQSRAGDIISIKYADGSIEKPIAEACYEIAGKQFKDATSGKTTKFYLDPHTLDQCVFQRDVANNPAWIGTWAARQRHGFTFNAQSQGPWDVTMPDGRRVMKDGTGNVFERHAGKVTESWQDGSRLLVDQSRRYLTLYEADGTKSISGVVNERSWANLLQLDAYSRIDAVRRLKAISLRTGLEKSNRVSKGPDAFGNY